MTLNTSTILLSASVLAIIELIIVIVSKKLRLGPDITERSSHTKFTPTGGGIVWVIAGIWAVYTFGNTSQPVTWYFIIGILVLAIVSYIDDLHPLPPVPRLICQTIVMALTFKQLWYPEAFDIFLIVLFCGVGLINSINFLDGIRGMLALYGIVVTGSILFTIISIGNPQMDWMIPVLVMVLTAQLVFTVFNLGDVIFAGDVGSITLGYIQAVIAINIMLATRDGSYMIYFIVCLTDTGLTTVNRLFHGESILRPHNVNIYQLLTGRLHYPHLVVSGIYALLQLVIDIIFLAVPVSMHWTCMLVTTAVMTVTYFIARSRIEKKINARSNQ